MLFIPRFISFSLSFCMLFVLMGCSTKTVTVTDDDEFFLMTRRFAAMLYEQKILDAEGQYISPFLELAQTMHVPEDFGKILYSRLDANFYYKTVRSTRHISELPKSFEESYTLDDTVIFSPYGFALKQKLENIVVQLLAITDWDGDREDDYIILVRARHKDTREVYDYYLVLDNLDEPILKGLIIGTHDYGIKKTKIYGLSLLFESLIGIDVEAGFRPIVLPRDTSMQAQDATKKTLDH